MNLLLKRKFVAGAALIAFTGFFASSASAQGTTSTADSPEKDKDKTITLEKFEVTGSYIPQASGALASPVTSISAEMLETSVVATNALDVLRKTIPQFQGNANIGSNNANVGSGSTGGGSQASLRNLTTLTLINGRRAAVSPISGTGGNQFVDLNILPLNAIESIDVLLDGASATYGSDATSGVLNIRTKSNYNGAEVGGFYQWSPNQGKWANRGGSFIVGAGNGKTNVTIAGGYSSQDPLYQFERGFSAVAYGTPTFGGVINFGGNYFVLNPAYKAPPVATVKPVVKSTSFPIATASIPNAPDGKPYFGAVGSNAVYWGKASGSNIVGFGAGELAGATTPEAEKVAFNLAQYVTLIQERTSRGVMATFDHQINDQVTFFGDVLMSQIDTKSQINAQPIGTTTSFNVDSTYAYNPFDTGVGTSTATTVRVRNRFVTNPRVYKYDTSFFRIVGGFKGEITDRISYETAVNLNKSTLAYANPGVIDSAGLLAAAGITPRGTGINLFQANIDPAAVAAANFVGVATNSFESTLASWDGRIVAKAFELNSNDVTIAVGGEYRRDALSGTADLNSIPDIYGNIKWTGATSVNPFTASRTVTAVFAEVLVPFTTAKNSTPFFHTLELDLAVRHEKYSDTDDPTVPKISFRWLPVNDEFAIRGTFGQSFNAPTLYQLVGPSDVGFTPEVQLLPHGAADVPGNYVVGQGQIRGGSNRLLKPATSDSYTFGVVYSPNALKGFAVEATYWSIKEKDVVGVISSESILQDVEDKGPNSQYIRNLPNGTPNPAYTGDRANPASYDVLLDGFGADGVPITAPGQVANQIDSVYMQRPLENIAEQKASGIDLLIKHKFDVAALGKFTFSSNFAYLLNYEYAGETLDGRATTTGGTMPRWSNYTLLTMTRGNIEAFIGNRYIPKVNAPEETSGRDFMESYDSVDVGVSYLFNGRWVSALKGLKITLAVDNVGNEAPPLAPGTFTEANVDHGTYSAIGRTYLIRAEFKF